MPSVLAWKVWMTLSFAAYPLLSRANKIVPIAKAIHQLLRIEFPLRKNSEFGWGTISSRLPDWALLCLLRFGRTMIAANLFRPAGINYLVEYRKQPCGRKEIRLCRMLCESQSMN